MLCQNCGSSDSVTIQGQEYCLVCGHLVGQAKEKVKAKVKSATKAAGTAVTIAKKPTAKKPAATLVTKKAAPIAATAPRPVAKKKPAPLYGRAALEAQQARPPRRISDIGGVARRPAVAPTVPAASTDPRPAPAPAPVSAPKKMAAAPVKSISKAQTPTKPRHRSRVYIAPIATGFGVVSGALVAASQYAALDTDITAYALTGTAVAAVGVIIATEAALLYGWSRLMDGRPVDRKQWWVHGWSGFASIVSVSLVAWVLSAAVIGLGAAAWIFGKDVAGVPAWAPAVGITLVNLVLVWLLLGLTIMRRMAVVAIAVGGFGAREALSVGWKLYRRVGGHLVMALVDTTLVRGAALMLVAALAVGSARAVTAVPAVPGAAWYGLATMLSVIIVMCVMLRIEPRIWLERYRQWAPDALPSLRSRLLAGRVGPVKPMPKR